MLLYCSIYVWKAERIKSSSFLIHLTIDDFSILIIFLFIQMEFNQESKNNEIACWIGLD